METATERKYALTRIEAGDYLLPSNDGRTLWRLSTYADGPSYGLVVDWKADRKFWGVWKFDGYFDGSFYPEDMLDWERWEMMDGSCATRQEAVKAALGYLATT